MDDFTFPEIRGISLTLREEDDELDATPEASPDLSNAVLDEKDEGVNFPQVSNLFIVVAVILILAVLINFLLRRRRIRFGRIPNAPTARPGGGMPAVPPGTNSLHPDALPTYDTQSSYYNGQPQNYGGQPVYQYPDAPYGQSQQHAYPQRPQGQHTFVPFG